MVERSEVNRGFKRAGRFKLPCLETLASQSRYVSCTDPSLFLKIVSAGHGKAQICPLRAKDVSNVVMSEPASKRLALLIINLNPSAIKNVMKRDFDA